MQISAAVQIKLEKCILCCEEKNTAQAKTDMV